jgi:hypothetical protein
VVVDARLPYWLNDAKGLSEGIAALSNDPVWAREYGQDSLFLFRRKTVSVDEPKEVNP